MIMNLEMDIHLILIFEIYLQEGLIESLSQVKYFQRITSESDEYGL
jgi:hypothetical protein